MNLRKYILPAFIFGLILVAGSCEDLNTLVVDCNECEGTKLDTADLLVYVTLNDENPIVPLVLYRGNVEEGHVDYVDTAYESPHHIPAAVDQFYSITAEYRAGDKIIVAVDGDKMKIKNEDDTCGPTCWIIKGGYLKVVLKF